MNVIAAFQLAEAIAGRQSLETTYADIKSIYDVYTAIQANGFVDLATMKTAGTLVPAVTAFQRTSALALAILDDKTQGPALIALLASL